MLFLQLNLSSEDSEGVAAEKDWNEKNKKEKKCTQIRESLNRAPRHVISMAWALLSLCQGKEPYAVFSASTLHTNLLQSRTLSSFKFFHEKTKTSCRHGFSSWIKTSRLKTRVKENHFSFLFWLLSSLISIKQVLCYKKRETILFYFIYTKFCRYFTLAYPVMTIFL
jgi:hypothetical protein